VAAAGRERLPTACRAERLIVSEAEPQNLQQNTVMVVRHVSAEEAGQSLIAGYGEPQYVQIMKAEDPQAKSKLAQKDGWMPISADDTDDMLNWSPPANLTTLKVCNLPARYSTEEVVEELNSLGLQASFDFLFIPLSKRCIIGAGYVIINFVNVAWAVRGWKALSYYKFKHGNHSRLATVSFARIQGFEANLQHQQRLESAMTEKRRRAMLKANLGGWIAPSSDQNGGVLPPLASCIPPSSLQAPPSSLLPPPCSLLPPASSLLPSHLPSAPTVT